MLAQDVTMVHETQETIDYIQCLLDAYKGVLADFLLEEEMDKAYTTAKHIELLEKNLAKEYAKQDKAYHNLLVLYL